jgi:hypothetical protein
MSSLYFSVPICVHGVMLKHRDNTCKNESSQITQDAVGPGDDNFSRIPAGD